MTAKDRPGLLYDLAQVFAAHKLRLDSAHLGSYGERVTDIFYIQTAEQEKLKPGKWRDGLSAALCEVMKLDRYDAPRTPARVLARSRSAESF